MTGSAHGLTSPPADDWRARGACLGEDPELWFPIGTTSSDLLIIEQAKTICRRCPSVEHCLQWALDTRQDSGIWGGLDEKQRAGLRRSATRRQLDAEDIAKKADKAREPQKPRTLQSIFDDNTTRLHGGHLTWTGQQKTSFRGRDFTPKQLCFTLDRGHYPNGRVTSDCGIPRCVLPAHLVDLDERGWCGSRAGYQRHLREKTEICTLCRKANTDADNRLRRTGTTKAAA